MAWPWDDIKKHIFDPLWNAKSRIVRWVARIVIVAIGVAMAFAALLNAIETIEKWWTKRSGPVGQTEVVPPLPSAIVSLNVSPSRADCYVDAEKKPRPYDVLLVAPGEREIECRAPGYQHAVTIVTVGPGQRLEPPLNLPLLKANPRGKVSSEPTRHGNTDVRVTDVSYVKNERIFYVWLSAPRMPPILQVGIGAIDPYGNEQLIGKTSEFQTGAVAGDASEAEVSSSFDAPADFVLHRPPSTYFVVLRDCDGPCGKNGTVYTVVFPSAEP
jgi:hypothetical protein